MTEQTVDELKAEIETLKASLKESEGEEPEKKEEEPAEPEPEEKDDGASESALLKNEISLIKKEMKLLSKELTKAKSVNSENVAPKLKPWQASEVKKDSYGNYSAEWNYEYWRDSPLRRSENYENYEEIKK